MPELPDPGGVSAPGGVWLGGCLLLGVGCLLGGVVSNACTEGQPPVPREQNDKQVQKYYLATTFVAAGKY